MPSVVDTSVKFVGSWMPGTPVINNTVGGMFTAMDIMVNGADSRACTVTVTSGVAEIAFTGGAHMATLHAVVLISGTGEADVDGEQKITAVNAVGGDTLTFLTNAPDGVYTGTFMLAPMGWEKVFTGTNKAVYRSLDVFSERKYLRMSQTDYRYVTVRAYETMSTVDVGTNPMPTVAEYSDALCLWWLNSSNNSTPLRWCLVTDGTRMYHYVEMNSTSPTYAGGYVHMFGPIKSRPEIVDTFNTYLTFCAINVYAGPSGITCGANNASTGKGFISRSYTGVGSHLIGNVALGGTGITPWGAYVNTWGSSYPDPVCGAIITSPVYAVTGSTAAISGIRGEIPGIRIMCQTATGIFNTGDFIDINGRTHLSLLGCTNQATTFANCAPTWVDIEGPW